MSATDTDRRSDCGNPEPHDPHSFRNGGPEDGDHCYGLPALDAERDERLRGIQERAAAATEGPWVTEEGEYPDDCPIHAADAYLCTSPDDGVRGGHSAPDAAFIAAARTDVPWLLAEVARLDAVVTAVRDTVDSADGEGPVTQADGEHIPVYLIRRALDGGAS